MRTRIISWRSWNRERERPLVLLHQSIVRASTPSFQPEHPQTLLTKTKNSAILIFHPIHFKASSSRISLRVLTLCVVCCVLCVRTATPAIIVLCSLLLLLLRASIIYRPSITAGSALCCCYSEHAAQQCSVLVLLCALCPLLLYCCCCLSFAAAASAAASAAPSATATSLASMCVARQSFLR